MDFEFNPKLLVLVPIALIIIGIAISTVAIVPAGARGILLTWGAVNPTPLGEGLHFITPIMNKVDTMSVQTQKYEVSASAATKDMMDVATTVAVNYHLDPSQTSNMYQLVGKDYQDRLIVPAVQEVVKASTANYNAGELLTERPAVKSQIEDSLKQRMLDRGIIIETISITNFAFPSSFNDAITAAQTAKQQAEKAKNDLVRIQVEAEQKVAQATGEATATLTKAKAEAQSIEIRGQALKNNPQVSQLEAINKWNGQLPNYMLGSGAVPFVNIPIAG